MLHTACKQVLPAVCDELHV